jgi:uncharacterized phage-like protein YoqJ
VRPRRMLDPQEQDALKSAIRQSFNKQEQKRDEDFEAQARRLLTHIDEFEKGAGNARPAK